MYNKIGEKDVWPLLLLSFIIASASCSYVVNVYDNGPIVKGGNLTFQAVLLDGDRMASGSFSFDWEDTAVPTHVRTYETKNPVDSWTVPYNDTVYPAGRYVMQVTVCKNYLVFCPTVASTRLEFYINETLNGEIMLIQKNQTRSSIFVSNADTVVHNVSLKQTDADLIKRAPTVLTYWFVDCTYYGVRRDFIFPFNYTQADKEHFVEALVVADFTPLPPPTTTTTTTSTTTTSTTTTTTAAPTTTSKTTTVGTTLKPTSASVSVVKRDLKAQASKIMVNISGHLQGYNGSFPFVCNSTQIATDPHKTYGYFFKAIKVKAPVSKVNVTGNNWLQHGDLLTLNVKCHGSKNLKYCVNYVTGGQNVTGNESCNYYHELEKCEFTIQRYFVKSAEHTIIIIIENEVSKIVTPVAVTVYKVKKQAQLSVIVVPVAFSLVAVVLIVFGVAYYIQNRSRSLVEVADFNFGQNYSDMEYKTFKERLRDSIANAFFSRAPSPGSSEVPVWPPGRKYGSMTS